MPISTPARRTSRSRSSSTGLQLRPRIAASYPSEQTRTVTLTNDGSTAVRMGRASLGGRHPEAFAIDVDGDSLAPQLALALLAEQVR